MTQPDTTEKGKIMKRIILFTMGLLVLSMAVTGCRKSNDDNSEVTAENNGANGVTTVPSKVPSATNTPVEAVDAATDNVSAQLYQDGVYKVETPLDDEKYYTEATVTIEGGKITSVDWTIIDTGHDNAPFDEEYYHVMEPYAALYVQQAKDDWSGSRGYSEVLIETQDVDKVDAVSGATWTNKKFKEVVKLALEQAKVE